MQSKFRVILRIGFDIITTMIVQNIIFITNFFPIDSFDSWKYPLGEGEKQICSTMQKETVQSKFRVFLLIRFKVITTMIVQNTIFRTDLFQIESFHSWTCPLGETEKKSVEPCSREQCIANSELSF